MPSQPLKIPDFPTAAVHTPKEIAALVGVSRRVVYDWITYGWLRAHRIGGRWLITAEDLDFFRWRSRGGAWETDAPAARLVFSLATLRFRRGQ